MRLARRLFVVPLADNNHGKTSIIRALVSQAEGRAYKPPHPHKSERRLVTPWGRVVDAYVFGRSFQEVEKKKYTCVKAALDANDPGWRNRELIIMPSHVGDIHNDEALCGGDDIDQMFDAAHEGGFDIICVSVHFVDPDEDRSAYWDIWRRPWDERWTIPNPEVAVHDKGRLSGQLAALGSDLWTWISRALTP
jgi:hypothetical protein